MFFCSPSVPLIPNPWKYYQRKGRGMGRQNEIWSQTQDKFLVVSSKANIFSVSPGDTKSWKDHHIHPYKISNNTHIHTSTHAHPDKQQIQIFYLSYQRSKEWPVLTKREEVRILSYFGQMQPDTSKKNLAKIINKLVKMECRLAKTECRSVM